MINPFKRVPTPAAAVETFDSAVDRVLPTTDEQVSTYQLLTGVWVAGGAYVVDKTVDLIESGNASELEIAVAAGASCVATLASVVLWRQAGRSEGEANI